MRVVLDGVFNHTGRGFWPFHHVLETGAASPYLDWFHLDHEALDAGRPLRAYPPSPRTRPAATATRRLGRDELRARLRAWWGLPALPKLNTDNPEVREYLLRVAEHWLRFGIDGWRLDVAAEIDDEAFWQEFRRRCRAVHPDAYLVGEIWHVDARLAARRPVRRPDELPAGEAILGFAGGATCDIGDRRATTSTRGACIRSTRAGLRRPAWSTCCAPTTRTSSRSSSTSSAATTRPAPDHAAATTWRRVRLATLLQMTLPGAPCIYYGDEVGLTGGHDPESRARSRADPAAGDRELRAFVRAAVRLRHDHAALRRGMVRAARGRRHGRRLPARGRASRHFVVASTPARGRRRSTSTSRTSTDGAGDGRAGRLAVAGGRPGARGRRPGRDRPAGPRRRSPARLGIASSEPCHARDPPNGGADVTGTTGHLADPRRILGTVSDLPFELEAPLVPRLRAAADVEGKIAAPSMRSARWRDARWASSTSPRRPPRPARRCRDLGRPVPLANPLALDVPDGCLDASSACGRRSAAWTPPTSPRRTASCARRAAARRPRLRPRRRLRPARPAVARVPRLEPARGPVPARAGFKIRVVHCFWTFASIEEARAFLGDAFGEAGEAVGAGLKRPRLSLERGRLPPLAGRRRAGPGSGAGGGRGVAGPPCYARRHEPTGSLRRQPLERRLRARPVRCAAADRRDASRRRGPHLGPLAHHPGPRVPARSR